MPYLMSSHPGSTLRDAVELALFLKQEKLRPEQVQDFYPTPGTISTCMFYTGLDPYTLKEVHIPRTDREKAMQRALLQYFDPKKPPDRGGRPCGKPAVRISSAQVPIAWSVPCRAKQPPCRIRSGKGAGNRHGTAKRAPFRGRKTPEENEKNNPCRCGRLSCAYWPCCLGSSSARRAGERLFRTAGLGDIASQADGSPFLFHVLDVGKADALLLECEGHFMLVDGGTVDQGVNVCRYLEKNRITYLDYVVNTHPDKDHIGGLADVLEEVAVGTYLSPRLPEEYLPDSVAYRNTEQVLQQEHIVRRYPAVGETFALGSAEVQVLGPVELHEDSNNNSLVLRVTYGQTRFLLMGDAERDEEYSLMERGIDLSADVLKVGHHGSNTSSSPAFLKQVSPEYAVIPVGESRHNLPKKEALDRLRQAGISTWRTDQHGTVIFTSDGEEIAVFTEKGTSPAA